MSRYRRSAARGVDSSILRHDRDEVVTQLLHPYLILHISLTNVTRIHRLGVYIIYSDDARFFLNLVYYVDIVCGCVKTFYFFFSLIFLLQKHYHNEDETSPLVSHVLEIHVALLVTLFYFLEITSAE